MSSRTIELCNLNQFLVHKIIVVDEEDEKIWNIHFPNVEEVQRDTNTLMSILRDIEDPMRQAILQQYNEILIYQAAPLEYKDMLAPQLKIKYFYKNNLPVILYPRMQPLVSRDIEDNPFLKLYTGWHLCQTGIDIKDVKKFFDELPNLCSYFGLVEEDIVNNFQNIGYDNYLGLRVLDYGLCEDEIFIG